MSEIIQMDVKYYAVYPNGRRCSVTAADAEAYGETWRKEGVILETDIEEKVVPSFGKVKLVRL